MNLNNTDFLSLGSGGQRSAIKVSAHSFWSLWVCGGVFLAFPASRGACMPWPCGHTFLRLQAPPNSGLFFLAPTLWHPSCKTLTITWARLDNSGPSPYLVGRLPAWTLIPIPMQSPFCHGGDHIVTVPWWFTMWKSLGPLFGLPRNKEE